MNLQTINKNQLLEQLNEQFGIKQIPENIILIKLGEEKIFAFSGDLQILWKIEKLNINIAGVGNYIAKEQGDEIRLSIEGTHLFKNQITKNIFELNQEQKDLWMHGSEILLDDASKDKFRDEGILDNDELVSKNIVKNSKLINSPIKTAVKIKDINNKKIIANKISPECNSKEVERQGTFGALREQQIKRGGEQLHDIASKNGVGLRINSMSQGGVKIKKGFVIMKHRDDFLGTGKASENKIGNFIPKNRRLREKL